MIIAKQKNKKDSLNLAVVTYPAIPVLLKKFLSHILVYFSF